jgi:hypothetical protein
MLGELVCSVVGSMVSRIAGTHHKQLTRAPQLLLGRPFHEYETLRLSGGFDSGGSCRVYRSGADQAADVSKLVVDGFLATSVGVVLLNDRFIFNGSALLDYGLFTVAITMNHYAGCRTNMDAYFLGCCRHHVANAGYG